MVGETDRRRHVGARVAPALLSHPPTSVVLRTVWRVEENTARLTRNTRPVYQQLLTGVELVVWLDSSDEGGDGTSLEQRVCGALERPAEISRSRRPVPRRKHALGR